MTFPVFERFERDFSWEESKMKALNELGFNSREGKRFYLNKKFTSSAESDLYVAINFVNTSGEYLDKAGIKLRHRLNQEYYLGKINLHLESREKEDWFDLHMVVQFASHSIPFFALIRLHAGVF